MEHSVMKDVPEKDCPIHGKPMRRSGLVYYCDLCRDNVPALPPSNGRETMTLIEALRIIKESCAGSVSSRAAYDRVVGELRILRALKKEA